VLIVVPEDNTMAVEEECEGVAPSSDMIAGWWMLANRKQNLT